MERFEGLAAEHAEWSQATFGADSERDWRGPLAHLRKEIDEIESDPHDAEEWADGLLLLLDGARRAGVDADTLIVTAIYKLDVNKRRIWQKPNADGSVEHVRKEVTPEQNGDET